MHNRLVIVFGLVATFGCISLSVNARADAKHYAIVMEALGLHDEFAPQLLGDLEEFLSGTGTPRPEAQEAILVVLRTLILDRKIH